MPHDTHHETHQHLEQGIGHENTLPSAVPFSILRADLGVRLGFVSVLIAVLWLSIFWALG